VMTAESGKRTGEDHSQFVHRFIGVLLRLAGLVILLAVHVYVVNPLIARLSNGPVTHALFELATTGGFLSLYVALMAQMVAAFVARPTPKATATARLAEQSNAAPVIRPGSAQG
jgi:tetrahydromethanopterin S-methyltransferase subunit E